MSVVIDNSTGVVTDLDDFQRSTSRFIVDYQGTVILIGQDEVPWQGLKRVDHQDSNYYNANVQGIEYQVSGTPPVTVGISLEPAATNLIQSPNDFDNGDDWYEYNVTLTDQYGTSPDGTTNTWLVDATSGNSGLIQGISGIEDNSTYVCQIWIGDGGNSTRLRIGVRNATENNWQGELTSTITDGVPSYYDDHSIDNSSITYTPHPSGNGYIIGFNITTGADDAYDYYEFRILPDNSGAGGTLEIWYVCLYKSPYQLTYPVDGIKNADGFLQYPKDLISQGAGSVKLIMQMLADYDQNDESAANLIGLDDPPNILYENSTDGTISTNDGTNINSIAVAWLKDDRLDIRVDWEDGGDLSLEIYDADTESQIGSTETTSYDGAFGTADDYLRIGSSDRPKILEYFEIVGQEIVANSISLADSADTFSASGTYTQKTITADSISLADSADTFSASGTYTQKTITVDSISLADSADTFSASGTYTQKTITADSISLADSADTFSASGIYIETGAQIVASAINFADSPDTFSASGVLQRNIVADSISLFDSTDTFSASGTYTQKTITANSISLGDSLDTFSASGDYTQRVIQASAVSLEDSTDSFSAVGNYIRTILASPIALSDSQDTFSAVGNYTQDIVASPIALSDSQDTFFAVGVVNANIVNSMRFELNLRTMTFNLD